MKAGFLLDVNVLIAMAWPDHEAHEKVQEWLSHHAHKFWADELGVLESLKPLTPRLAGHQQVTDAYLLGLALHRKEMLATMDRALLAMLPEKSRAREFIEMV